MIRAAALAALLLPLSAMAEPGVVEVTVTGVHSAVGHVLVALCGREEFLQPTCRHIARAPAAIGAVTVRISGVAPGTYAAQAYQDENDNGNLDRNLLGMPKEGLGFSNDAPMRFGPPSFADAAFTLGPNGARLSFALHYY